MDNTAFDAAPYSLLAFIAEAFKTGRTGTLRVQRGAYIQTAYLKDGRVAYASSNVNEEKFGAVLKTMGLIGDKELALATEKKEGKESLGKALMRLGFISNQDLYKAAIFQTQYITSHLIAQGGEAHFDEGRLPDNLADLKVPGDQLLRELAQGIEDRASVLTALGGVDGGLQRSAALPAGVSLLPDEKALHDRLAQPTCVRDLIADPTDGFAVAKHLYFLLLCGAAQSVNLDAAGGMETMPLEALENRARPAPAEPQRLSGMDTTAALPTLSADRGGQPAVAGMVQVARHQIDINIGDDEPTVKEMRISKTETSEIPPVEETAELDATAAPSHSSAASRSAPFIAMESALGGIGSASAPPRMPSFGMADDLAPAGGSPFAPPPGKRRKKSGGGMLAATLGLLLVLAGGGYWFFALGPGAKMLSIELPLPAVLRTATVASTAASAAVSANPKAPSAPRTMPRSAPIETPPPSAPAPILSAPAASVPAAIPAPSSIPTPPAADGFALLKKADYPAAAQWFKRQMAQEKGYTLQFVVLCSPQISAAPKIAGLPDGAPYMLLPVTFNGNPNCYRELYGRYPSLDAAAAAKQFLPDIIRKSDSMPAAKPVAIAQVLKAK